jgi:hypothetical protein
MALEVSEDDTGAGRDLAGDRVDGLELAQVAKADDDLTAQRNAARDHPGVPALWNDGDAVITAVPNDAGDLFGRRRADDDRRPPTPASRPVGLVLRDDVGVVDDVGRSDDGGEIVGEGVGQLVTP